MRPGSADGTVPQVEAVAQASSASVMSRARPSAVESVGRVGGVDDVATDAGPDVEVAVADVVGRDAGADVGPDEATAVR